MPSPRAERAVSPMTRVSIAFAIVAAATGSLLPTRCHAQITPYVDDRGKLVFINRDSTVRRTGSTISAVAAAAKDKLASDSTEPPSERLDHIVSQAAARNNLDPELVKAVISTESGWNPWAVSRKGAFGLMQLIPGTAQRYGVGNVFDPAQNVEGGTMYLRTLLDKYNGDLPKSLAAYNAGERAVDQSGGVPWYPETQRYVRKVTQAYFRPGSDHDASPWKPPGLRVRREVDSNGRVVFTNE